MLIDDESIDDSAGASVRNYRLLLEINCYIAAAQTPQSNAALDDTAGDGEETAGLPRLYRALFDFNGNTDDGDLSFKANDIIVVTEEEDDPKSWW